MEWEQTNKKKSFKQSLYIAHTHIEALKTPVLAKTFCLFNCPSEDML